MLRPTLSEFVLKMPRGAQVIYPKDIGPLLLLADIVPGVRVFEAGVGSGALSMGMLRAGADITGYELREDFADRAPANVEKFLGADALARYDVRAARQLRGHRRATSSTGSCSTCPSPGRSSPTPSGALRPGGIIVAYSPSIIQVMQFRERARQGAGFALAETIEVLHRGLARRGRCGAARPPHGRPHRLPHQRPARGARAGRTGREHARLDLPRAGAWVAVSPATGSGSSGG